MEIMWVPGRYLGTRVLNSRSLNSRPKWQGGLPAPARPGTPSFANPASHSAGPTFMPDPQSVDKGDKASPSKTNELIPRLPPFTPRTGKQRGRHWCL